MSAQICRKEASEPPSYPAVTAPPGSASAFELDRKKLAEPAETFGQPENRIRGGREAPNSPKLHQKTLETTLPRLHRRKSAYVCLRLRVVYNWTPRHAKDTGYLNNDKPWEDLPFKVAETTLGTPTWSPLFLGCKSRPTAPPATITFMTRATSRASVNSSLSVEKNSTACLQELRDRPDNLRRQNDGWRRTKLGSKLLKTKTVHVGRAARVAACARVKVVSLLTELKSPSSAGPGGEQRRFLQGFSQIACPLTTIVLSSSHCNECNAARHWR